MPMHLIHSINTDFNTNLSILFAVFVKQEPEDQHMKRQMQHAVVASAALAAAGQNNVNAGYVSSTTHMNGYNLPNRPVNGQPNAGKTKPIFTQLRSCYSW